MEAKNNKYFILFIIIAIGVAFFYLNRTPYGNTPEEAVNAYLNSVTSSYHIKDEKKQLYTFDSNYTNIVVTADCQYNWRGSNQGRVDGVNIYFFDLSRDEKGWYVTAANSGP